MLTASRIGQLTLAATALGGAVLATSCSYYPYDCADYAECGPPDPDTCPGQCVPLPPLDFSGPTLLWMGREPESPGCPDRAPRKVFEGHGNLNDSNVCPPCECSEPACVPPSTLTVSLAPCPGVGPSTSFNAPPYWNGTCTSPTTIPAGQVGSVVIPPVTVRPCEPIQDVPRNAYGTWGQLAFACAGEAIPNVCANPGETCLPTAEPPPPGFQQCIMYNRDGDTVCPADFPEKHLFYKGLDDTRGCTACECTQTVASNCVASLSIYQQQGCGQLIHTAMQSFGNSVCVDVQVGVQLGSMKATMLPDEPGSCVASGGTPTGHATPLEPRTFCCQPPP